MEDRWEETGGDRPRPPAGLRLALLFVVSILIFGATTAVWSFAVVRAFDYLGAYKCSSTPNAACYTVQQDVVQSIGTDGAGTKSPVPYVVLSRYGKFDESGNSALWSVAHPGDPATVRIYHGEVATIEVRGVTGEVSDNPALSARHSTGIEIGALGLLLCALALFARERVPWFRKAARAYAVWALPSGVAVGMAVGLGPMPLWIAFAAVALIVGVLISVEFYVLQPRLAAREAEG